MQIQPSPLILTFGVADPVGALGVQADLATFAAHGCHALSIPTALLVADSARVEEWHEVDTGVMADQARQVLEDMPVAAVKIGAIASIEQAAAIAEIVSDYADVPLIVDPFLSALPDSGMSDEDIVASIRQILAPQATILQLSQSELGRMAELWREAGADGGLEIDVAELTSRGCQYVLVTCTSGSGNNRANTLFDRDGVVTTIDWQHLPGPFVGAGTTLSGALAALMARGLDAAEALAAAREFTYGALRHAQRFGMGKLVPNRFFRAHLAHGQ
ncbi:bifunctional hydroxymethylpyrimidine kinase/phosphomethylpyrimidine kinase [Massilia sp. Se16.2.3]|uniref:bifunctional hydroxymethylpyrimidine kinase/phosphomethylpyrimidine kinase n=1 Tax=Massilia sp. Se16.2.3 TaxID=2709303 RepID=UPI00160062BB|nr:bifunctional hydroxymethylpyrimidine kinase/phosphomethylpyrimidine kinase [Massilia sp. Se16.2.3]QNA97633.1 hydroxymethylpyrimidine/phosphomethylpyrimidine kinase [Massilia sp. Se16.2.3]